MLPSEQNWISFFGNWTLEYYLSKLLQIGFLEISCGKPASLRSRIITYSTVVISVGTKASFSCISGHYLDGADSIVCQDNGEWSDHFSLCKGKPAVAFQQHFLNSVFSK